MRRTITGLACIATAATLAACGSSSHSSSAQTAPSGQSALAHSSTVTRISVWEGLDAADGQAFQKAVSQFNAANAGRIKVTATYQGVYADLLAKYVAAVRSKSIPTVVLAGDVATGYLTDLKKSVPAAAMAKANPGELDLADLSPTARAYYTVDHTQEGVPMATSTPMLWVNRTILKRAGVSMSSLKTLNGVVAAARQIKQKTGIAGFSTEDDDWYIEQLTATAGQDFCTPDNGRGAQHPTAITINTGLAKTNIARISSLYTSGDAIDGGATGSTAIAAFQAGKVGMIIMSSGILGDLQQGRSFAYQALPYPTSGPAGRSGPVIGGSALWLSASATPAQKEAGWKLEAYLTSPTVQAQFGQATGYIPINLKSAKTASEQAYLRRNPSASAAVRQLDDTPAVQATAGCASGAMQSIKTSDMSHIENAWSGHQSIASALDQSAASAKTLFEQYEQQANGS